MSKAELARRAGVSALTVQRVESGAECRVETKRKIILALGKTLDEKEEVFPLLLRGRERSREVSAATKATTRSEARRGARRVGRSKTGSKEK